MNAFRGSWVAGGGRGSCWDRNRLKNCAMQSCPLTVIKSRVILVSLCVITTFPDTKIFRINDYIIPYVAKSNKSPKIVQNKRELCPKLRWTYWSFVPLPSGWFCTQCTFRESRLIDTIKYVSTKLGEESHPRGSNYFFLQNLILFQLNMHFFTTFK
jgi:hypothetical protein